MPHLDYTIASSLFTDEPDLLHFRSDTHWLGYQLLHFQLPYPIQKLPNGSKVSNAARVFTTDGRPVFTREGRPVFTSDSGVEFTTDRPGKALSE